VSAIATRTGVTGGTGVIVRPAPRSRAGWNRSKKKLKRALRYVVLLLTLVIVLIPIYEMVLDAFQPTQWQLTWPPAYFFRGFNWGALTSVFQQFPLAEWLAHSALVSGVTVAITVLCAVPGGFLLSRLRWRGAGAFGFLLLFTQLMPGAMIIVPELEWYRTLHWTNNLLALGVVYAAFSVPVGCWIMKSAFDVVPNELVDAALVDGCTLTKTLYWVLLPLSRSGLIAVIVVAFFGSWNDYLFASTFITDKNLYTAGLGMAEFITAGNTALVQMVGAGLIFSILPIGLYMLVQRHIARGLTAGALK